MTGLLRAAIGAVVCMLGGSAFGAVLTVAQGQSSSAIQAIFNRAAPGDTVLFDAGTYNITSMLNVPCGVTLSGPAASPASAVLAASYTGNNIFSLPHCSRPTTIEYLHFENTGGIYVTAPSVGLTVAHNQFTNLPANFSQWTDMGIYFDGTSGGTISNVAITNNTFGDATSCSAVMSLNTDQGGDCDGIVFQGNLNGIVVENNEFTHLEEGFHVLCYGNVCSGPSAPTWINFVAQWNDFNNIHRIAMEMQPESAAEVTIQYNSYESAFAPSTFSMGISAACCAGIASTTTPYVNNNVLIANTQPAGEYIAYAIEWWGIGAQANSNLIQGYWAHGIVWGKGGPPWEAMNNTIEGPFIGAPGGCAVCDEKEGATSKPMQSGNTVNTTITPLASVAPTISQSGGTVEISDIGTNTSIYYTTDGSTPTTASTLYSAPFTPSPGSTVNAIGMWGQGANPKSYPAGYGYVPSAVVSVVVAGASSAATLQSILIAGASTISLDAVTPQFSAIGTYSDGTQEPLTPKTWASSNPAVCTVSTTGLVTPVAVGDCAITAGYEALSSAPFSIKVQLSSPTLSSLLVSSSATTLAVGATLQFSASGKYSNGTSSPVLANWFSSNTAVATVSSSGLLTAIQPGSTQISASSWGVNTTAPVSITVVTAGPVIYGYLGTPNSTNTLATCGTLQFTAYATYANGTTATVAPLAWTTSNNAIGTISPTGLFTANAPGTVSVNAQLTGSVSATPWVVTIVSAPAVTVPLAPGTYTIVVPACGSASLTGIGMTISQ